jgi:hypothetical protein
LGLSMLRICKTVSNANANANANAKKNSLYLRSLRIVAGHVE